MNAEAPVERAALGDRIAGAVLAVLALAAWWHAQNFVAGFMQPVGPAVFPRLVCVPLGLLALYLMVRPGINHRWPGAAALCRQLGVLLVLGTYAAFIEPWGFVPTTLVTAVLLLRLFGANWRQALPYGVLLGLSLYLLFEFALGIPLPDMPGLGV
ncbi:tripartite tricarboxylate transporter TctB family protein [Halomonas sabkhae]|uniref:tripartite tricarboxylate transporter TctB family protein n=1 Tax=Halomonas sabkhae TaxID=626223 RepID=UPI0025B5F5F4|nr:tripartite tricarboxylate transporter TctB family protein [Halomonas sabkhae]MDN3525376.1 tripartite tricarboxylate transporter TctB family protein [Halomonas sabkhae]